MDNEKLLLDFMDALEWVLVAQETIEEQDEWRQI